MKISNLSAASALTGSEIMPVVTYLGTERTLVSEIPRPNLSEPIQLVNTTTATNLTATVDVPSDYAEGDLCIFTITTRNRNIATLVGPEDGGWTLFASRRFGGGEDHLSFYKYAASEEPATWELTTTSNGGTQACATIGMVIRGATVFDSTKTFGSRTVHSPVCKEDGLLVFGYHISEGGGAQTFDSAFYNETTVLSGSTYTAVGIRRTLVDGDGGASYRIGAGTTWASAWALSLEPT